MSTTTPNLGLIKPELHDLVSPEPFNDNMDILDDTIHEMSKSMGATWELIKEVQGLHAYGVFYNQGSGLSGTFPKITFDPIGDIVYEKIMVVARIYGEATCYSTSNSYSPDFSVVTTFYTNTTNYNEIIKYTIPKTSDGKNVFDDTIVISYDRHCIESSSSGLKAHVYNSSCVAGSSTIRLHETNTTENSVIGLYGHNSNLDMMYDIKVYARRLVLPD